ncbi:MAG: FkbM family methyltransferase [Clostridiales bacterium]|nr:FkbM family methyltransferase [Clostridiales bacterium]
MNYHNLRAFYTCLEDEESRFIFNQRVQYLFNGNRECLRRMVEESNRLFHVNYLIRSHMDCPKDSRWPLVIYGGGLQSQECLRVMQEGGYNVDAFCDKNFEKFANEGHLGLPVLSPRELMSDRYSHARIVISTEIFAEDIVTQLLANRVEAHRIYSFGDPFRFSNYASGGYFDYFNLAEDEIFVDGGCFDGQSAREFVRRTNGMYCRILGFEPHPKNFLVTKVNLERYGIDRAEIIAKGLWSTSGRKAFCLEYGTGPDGARIAEFGDDIIETTTLDEALNGQKATFIKLDVEGAELEALKGAEQTLLRDKPKLAICVYHKPEDILEIPEYLYGLMPEYHFKLRHHNYLRDDGDIALDTVLYAWV